MGEITNEQVYDLAMGVSRNVERLEVSIDQLLSETRAFNQEWLSQRQFLFDSAQHFSKAYPQ